MMSNTNYAVSVSQDTLEINDLHGQRTYKGIFDLSSERFYMYRDTSFRPGCSVDYVRLYYDVSFNVVAYTEFATNDRELLSSINPAFFKYNRMVFEFDSTSRKLMLTVPSLYHLCFDDTKILYWAGDQYKISTVSFSDNIVTINTKGSDRKRTFIVTKDENGWTSLMLDGRLYNIVDRHIKDPETEEAEAETKTVKKVKKSTKSTDKTSETKSSKTSGSKSSKSSTKSTSSTGSDRSDGTEEDDEE